MKEFIDLATNRNRTEVREELVYVGVDYATAFVQVCVLDRGGRVLSNTRLDNDVSVLRRHAALFGRRVQAAIEACNGAANLADELIQQAGWSVALAHPGYVHRMKQSPDKSDFSDARMLADLVRVGYLPRVWLAPEAVRELRHVTRQRQDLVDRRREVKQRVGAALRGQRVAKPACGTWTRGWLRWLQALDLPACLRLVLDDQRAELQALAARIANFETHLEHLTQNDPLVLRLRSLRGLGLVTACVMRAEIGDVTRFRNGEQLARFCSLTPRNASSGERVADAGLIVACNRQLRATLIETAHRLRRYEPRWQAFGRELEARGKKRCVVIAAIANRWIRGLFHELLRLNQPPPSGDSATAA